MKNLNQNTLVDETIELSLEQLIGCQFLAKDNIPLPNKKTKAHLVGGHLSPFKGRGMEFSEVRQYQAGDDIRTIDWRVTARTGKTHTKIFQEERERPVFILLDLQDTMFFGSRKRFKSTLACIHAARAFWSAFNSGNRVGALLNTSSKHLEIKPSNRRKDGLRLLQKILEMHNQRLSKIYDGNHSYKINDNSLVDSLFRLQHLTKGGSLIYIFSDFFNLDSRSHNLLSQLSQHNDIFSVMINDPLEQDIPASGHYYLTDGANHVSIDTHKVKNMRAYRSAYSERLSDIQKQFVERKCIFTHVSTADQLSDLSMNPNKASQSNKL